MRKVDRPEYYKEIQSLCLMDDELMGLCFDGDNDACEILVRVILGREDLKITSAKTQVTLKGVMREVRLDVYASDDKGRKYNIEFQRRYQGADPERARYNSSMIDVNNLEKGGDFRELPEVYVIFITEYDPLKEGLPLYTVNRYVEETGKPFHDKSHIVYVNGAVCDVNTELGKLMHDLFCKKPEEMYYKPLAERVRYFKRDPKGVAKVNTVIDDLIHDKVALALELERRRARANLESEVESIIAPKLELLRKEYEVSRKEHLKVIALRMLETGKLALTEIATCTGLSVSTVRRMAKKLEEAKAAQAQA